jgi:hypothetical protein
MAVASMLVTVNTFNIYKQLVVFENFGRKLHSLGQFWQNVQTSLALLIFRRTGNIT